MKNILVPIDFSGATPGVLYLARQLAKGFSAQLHLIHVREILGTIDGIEFVEFGNQDVVRHMLVQRIVEAYKRHAEETGTQRRK